VPFVSPVIVALVADAAAGTGVCAAAPTYGVTVYPVIGLSPSAAGAVQRTRADCEALSAATAVGADGATAVSGVTPLDCAEATPEPLGLDAWTVNVYVVPVVRPVTVVVVSGGEPVISFGVCAVEPTYGVIV